MNGCTNKVSGQDIDYLIKVAGDHVLETEDIPLVPIGKLARLTKDVVYEQESTENLKDKYNLVVSGFMALTLKYENLNNAYLEYHREQVNKVTNLTTELERAGNVMRRLEGELAKSIADGKEEKSMSEKVHKAAIKKLNTKHSDELLALGRTAGDNKWLKEKVSRLEDELKIKDSSIASLKEDVSKLKGNKPKNKSGMVVTPNGRVANEDKKEKILNWARLRKAGMSYLAIATLDSTSKSVVLRTLKGETHKDLFPEIKKILEDNEQ